MGDHMFDVQIHKTQSRKNSGLKKYIGKYFSVINTLNHLTSVAEANSVR